MKFQLLFSLVLATAPAVVSGWALTWFSDENCNNALGHIDSGSSSLTSGPFASNVNSAMSADSGGNINLNGGGNGGLYLVDGACVRVVHTGGDVTWKYN